MSTNNGQRLAGKTAVITGGATGIGFAAAKRFIEEGAFVFIFGRRQEALDAAVAELGPNARAVKGSVSDLADLDRLYAAARGVGTAGSGDWTHGRRQVAAGCTRGRGGKLVCLWGVAFSHHLLVQFPNACLRQSFY
jgi:NAD(P)-dependent dehydrogenase (short-subunit alcohol dehydrogenase family)